MKRFVAIIVGLVVLGVVAVSMSGCGRQSAVVSRNVSKEADNFNVTRRLTVINTRTDKCLLQMTGKISIEDVTDGIAVLVEVDRDKGIYQKHWVYLNENTMYTVEDLNGVSVSKYAYELEFMPQQLVPVRITANELTQDVEQIVGDEAERRTDGE